MRDEVLAGFAWADGLESGHAETIEVTEALIFEPADPSYKPFAWVRELFDYRAELVKADKNSVLAIVIKLMLNSLYGKFAQGIGGFGRLPRFACPWFAAAITAGTRRKLMEAALTAPRSVVAFTTDALIMDKPPEFETTARGVKELGKWEYPKLYVSGSIVMPGVNFTLNEKGEGNMKTHGFQAAHAIDEKESATPTLERIMLEEIPAAWEADKAESLYVYQKYNGLGSALQTRFPGKVMGTWQVSQRGIKLTNATQKRTLPMDEKGLPAAPLASPTPHRPSREPVRGAFRRTEHYRRLGGRLRGGAGRLPASQPQTPATGPLHSDFVADRNHQPHAPMWTY
jgi:hypothetical protein